MDMQRKKISIHDLMLKKQHRKKITMLTAYDYPQARLMDMAGIDIVLVGDSLGMVVLGYESTVPVTMDEMIHHTKAVRRGLKYAFLIGDMPFISYQASAEDAVRNAARFLKEGGCDAVKVEGGRDVLDKIKAIIKAGISVQGHLGLTPQSAVKLGGFKVQGREAGAAKKMLNDARLLERAGCFSLVLECVPAGPAKIIAQSLKIPVIGCGAGPSCDGQVLVTYDMLGLFERFTPKFVKKYATLSADMLKAFKRYKQDVEELKFPASEHCFYMKKTKLGKLK